jgi:hypothetical protein
VKSAVHRQKQRNVGLSWLGAWHLVAGSKRAQINVDQTLERISSKIEMHLCVCVSLAKNEATGLFESKFSNELEEQQQAKVEGNRKREVEVKDFLKNLGASGGGHC